MPNTILSVIFGTEDQPEWAVGGMPINSTVNVGPLIDVSAEDCVAIQVLVPNPFIGATLQLAYSLIENGEVLEIANVLTTTLNPSDWTDALEGGGMFFLPTEVLSAIRFLQFQVVTGAVNSGVAQIFVQGGRLGR